MIEGANAMFVVWLNFFRMHCVNFASLFVMLPLTLFFNVWLGGILIVLVAFFAIAMNLVIGRSNELQDKANAVATNLAERVSDALANLPVVQSFNRIESETRDFEAVSERMLATQFPVLTWWAINSVATRTAATVTLFAIFVAGVALDLRGKDHRRRDRRLHEPRDRPRRPARTDRRLRQFPVRPGAADARIF